MGIFFVVVNAFNKYNFCLPRSLCNVWACSLNFAIIEEEEEEEKEFVLMLQTFAMILNQ